MKVGSTPRVEGGSDEIIHGVASVLQEASAALTRLGATSAPSAPDSPAGAGLASLANAALALTQAASNLKQGAGPSLESPPVVQDTGADWGGNGEVHDELVETAQLTSLEFVVNNNLDPWLEEALELLTPNQRAHVINSQVSLRGARNPNGIVMNRIRQVTPVHQRIDIFSKINNLGAGVMSRLEGLTEEQADAVMESGFKIMKATNPSGVAVKRINDVLATYGGRSGRDRLSRSRRGNLYGRGRDFRDSGTRFSTSSRCDALDKLSTEIELPPDILDVCNELRLERWCGAVLVRLSLYQRQNVFREIGRLRDVRNPSGVVMSRIRALANPDELTAIFIDINDLDRSVESKLWHLTTEQRAAVIAPGIYVQNVRNPSTAVRSRITNVLAGKDAMGRPPPVAAVEKAPPPKSGPHAYTGPPPPEKQRESDHSESPPRKKRRENSDHPLQLVLDGLGR